MTLTAVRPARLLALTAFVLAAFLWLVTTASTPGLGQDGTASSSGATSSLDLGPAFDLAAQRQFESSLSDAQRNRLIRLRSRFLLADVSCPVPAEADGVVYVTLTGALSDELAQQLAALHVRRVGYAFPRTHMLRGSATTDRDALRALLIGSGEVMGSAVRQPMDAASAELWQALQSAEPTQRMDLRVRVWRGESPAAVQQLLTAIGASDLDVPRDGSGTIDLANGYVDVQADAAAVPTLLADPRVEFVTPVPVLDAFNQNAVELANADGIDTDGAYNLDGSGEVIAVWDAGDAIHDDYNDRVTVVSNVGAHYHGTHVMGTILGSGDGLASARGFAPGATGFSYYYGGNVNSARRQRRHLSLHVADNHSYGSNSNWGGYSSICSTYDTDNRDLLLTMCKSAGNSGSGSTSIPGDSGMKNGFVVGATSDSGSIASFSSRGPMDDGRLLPTICANGVSLTSTSTNNGYVSSSGTSMSSPAFCGAITLLAQQFRQSNAGMMLPPDVAMAVVALTADDRGNAGPDYQYGFGLVDVRAAADIIQADGSSNGRHIVRGVARDGSVDEYTFDVTSAGELKLAMAFLDEPGTNGAGVAQVNNLDLELEAPDGTIHHPWRGLTTSGGSQTHQFTRDGANTRDNTELVTVDNAVTGRWTARVTGASLETASTAQGYVLAGAIPFDHNRVRVADSVNGSSPVSVPDNGALTRTLSVGVGETIRDLRLYVVLTHTRRGDVSITLESPAGTSVTLEDFEASPSTRDDIIAVFPDTRKYEDDVTALFGESSGGDWTVTIEDHHPGETGELRQLTLELVFDPTDGPLNQAPTAAATSYTVDFDLPASLDATGSSDPDGDALSFSWTQTSGPNVTLTGADTATPTFTTPSGPDAVTLTFEVTVSDGNGGVDTATATVEVFDGGGPGPGVGGGGGSGGGSGSGSSGGGGCAVSLSAATVTAPFGLLLGALASLVVVRRLRRRATA